MTDLQMWSLIVGFAAPLLIAAIEQPQWSPRIRALATAVTCIVFGAITALLSGELTGDRWLSSALVIGVAAITFYKGLWKPTGVAPSIESATSPGTGTRRAND